MTIDNADNADLVRRVFRAFETADRDLMESLLATDFTFTSPYDDHIDRATYWQRCWPGAGTFAGIDLKQVTVDGEHCFVVYEVRTKSGSVFRNTELFRVADGQVHSVEVFFGIEPQAAVAAAEQQIRGLIDLQLKAITARDADAVMADCAHDMLTFDVILPLANHGAGAARDRLEQWFAAYDGPIGTEIRDLAVETSSDVAFARFLQRFTGTMATGTEVDMWVRVTLGLRRIDGRWKILHEHMSDPFDPETGQARTDLKPERSV